MSMSKKGQVAGYVGAIILVTIATLLIVNLLIPQARTLNTLESTTESLVVNTAPVNTTYALTYDEVSSFTLNASLVLNTNYTLDADAGTVRFLDNVPNATYLASYSYEPEGYLDSASNRVLAGVIILAGIIGLLFFLFRIFGVA